jgi:hypothetical protein
MRVRNTIPLLVSIIPMLKYYIGNIIRRLRFFFLSIMPSSKSKKRKEFVILGNYIE